VSRQIVSQRTAVRALYRGYILQNHHGYLVWLEKGEQYLTNRNRVRHRKEKNRPYKFDFHTWSIVGRLPWWKRLINGLYLAFGKVPNTILANIKQKEK